MVDELEKLKPQLRIRYERVRAQRLAQALDSALASVSSEYILRICVYVYVYACVCV